MPVYKPAVEAAHADAVDDHRQRVVKSLIRLVGMVLVEQDDEWQDGRRYFRPESMALIDATAEQEEVAPALLMAS